MYLKVALHNSDKIIKFKYNLENFQEVEKTIARKLAIKTEFELYHKDEEGDSILIADDQDIAMCFDGFASPADIGNGIVRLTCKPIQSLTETAENLAVYATHEKKLGQPEPGLFQSLQLSSLSSLSQASGTLTVKQAAQAVGAHDVLGKTTIKGEHWSSSDHNQTEHIRPFTSST